MMTEAPRLDHTKPQGVQYCIPLWLRDQQIRLAIGRVQGRIQPGERRPEPVAVVCFGPSLRDTWEEVRDYPYVISCSGSHKFLVDRGIVPTWHVEVDPREHKVTLMGAPQKETQYLIASTCHPKVFDHLEGFDVRLWHVFDGTDSGHRLLPPGDWAITGGCDVGLRALTIAAFLGFRDVHVFGMDHSAGTEEAPVGRRHADEHPLGGKRFSVCEYKGVRYLTTPSMLEAARQVWHELDMMPAVKATFHGEGLCQAMSRDYVPNPAEQQREFAGMVAIAKPELISATYRDLNARLHRENLAYGVGGAKHAETVKKLVKAMNSQSVLDYGCGKGLLAEALPFPIWEYDPAIEGKSDAPRPADLVVCTDVLEHIEPTHLDVVLDDIRRCTLKVGYFVIHMGPASKTLPDGRNTHLIQKGELWWRTKLERHFVVGKMLKKGPELVVVVAPKATKATRKIHAA